MASSTTCNPSSNSARSALIQCGQFCRRCSDFWRRSPGPSDPTTGLSLPGRRRLSICCSKSRFLRASTPPSRDQLEQLGRVLLEKTSELRNLLAELIRPYSSQSVQRLIAQCQENLPERVAARRSRPSSKPPSFSSSDRQELWIAGLELEHRLGELPPQDNVSTTDPDASSERMASVTKLVGLRNDRLFALQKLADPTSHDKEPQPREVSGANAVSAKGHGSSEARSSMAPLLQAWANLSQFSRMFIPD